MEYLGTVLLLYVKLSWMKCSISPKRNRRATQPWLGGGVCRLRMKTPQATPLRRGVRSALLFEF